MGYIFSPEKSAAAFAQVAAREAQEKQEALFPLTPLDVELLSMKDEDFKPHTWEELRQIISENRLEDFKRVPSDVAAYIDWSAETKKRYGSIMNFVMRERLNWTWRPPREEERLEDTTVMERYIERVSKIPFADPSDYKILLNDWPYGWEPGLRHIVVWLKPRIPTDPKTGDLTPESRALIEGFVQKTFVEPLRASGFPGDSVQWFKNWPSIQSVRALEHFHVIVKDVPDEYLYQLTGHKA